MNLQIALHLVEVSLQVMGGVCVLATIVVRLTPSKKDDALVESVDSFFFKAISFLPTIGINPNTQKLKDALVDAQAQLEAADAAPVALATGTGGNA